MSAGGDTARPERRWIDIVLRYRQFIVLVTAILVLFGAVALDKMPRDEFPEFQIRQGLIVGVYPGASSEQVEEQLTKKIESHLFQYEAVDKIKTHSVSRENVSVVYVELRKSENDPEAFWAKLKHGLIEFKPQLPEGVLSLTANDDFGNTSAVLLAVESDTRSYRELEDCLESFEDGIRRIPATSRVMRFGEQQEEINVYVDDEKMAHYGVKPLSLFLALKPQGLVNYAGSIDDGELIRPIHIDAGYRTENDIAEQIVYSDPDGRVARVRDVARVVREYREPDSFLRLNGRKCLILSLEMLPGNNIVEYGEEVAAEIGRFEARVPSDVKIGVISDMPDFVSHSIVHFLKEFGIAIAAVILVTVLLLPRRMAVVAASSIPISIFITLGIMWTLGMTLQTVSLASLILVLGMVVDNAIVIVDSYVEKLDNGIERRRAASESVTELFGSVFSATLVLIFSFAPMVLILSGLAGDFVKSLPATVAIALTTSLGVSTTLVPLMSFVFIRHGIHGSRDSESRSHFLTALQSLYDAAIEKAFRRKALIVVAGLTSFIVGAAILTSVPQEPFPAFNRNQFAVEVQLPVGSSLNQTGEVMRQIEEVLAADPRVEEVAAFVGTSSPRFNTLYAPKFPAKHYGQLVVITESSAAALDVLDEYSQSMSETFPNAHVRWKQLQMSLADTPIEIRISGDRIDELKRTADQVSGIFREIAGAKWVRHDYREPLQAVRLETRRDELSRLGYSKTMLDYSLMVGTRGFPISTVWEGDYPLSVQLRVDERTKTSVDQILNQQVTSQHLVTSVPIRQLVEARPQWTEGEIPRRNGVRTITVSVDVERGVWANDVFAQAQPRMEALKLPGGVAIGYGGDYEMNVEEVSPLYSSLSISVAIIFVILLAQFRRTRTSLVIMTTMPLCLFGAAVGIFLTGYPFGVTALVGLISLMGIAVRNGIIYVSYAEELRYKHGYSVQVAALAAGKRRMRPIFLTAAAAAVGVIPMIISRSPLWGPLGTVICFGLLFAMVLSLFVLPVLYALVHFRDDDNKPEGEAA